MHLERCSLVNFRNHTELELRLEPGLCVVVGENGRGKTNLVEAIGLLATGGSFRGAPTAAMVQSGAESGIVRATAVRDGRELIVDVEVRANGRSQFRIDRQRVPRLSDLGDGVLAVVFAPDDLDLVKGGPGERRRFLDDVGTARDSRLGRLRSDTERILKQRNALLKQARGRLDGDAEATLDVWDDRLASAGDAMAAARRETVELLRPEFVRLVRGLDHGAGGVGLEYAASWSGPLLDALIAGRPDDVRRGVTLVGPHRDELAVTLDEMPARTHASQGQQRSLALGLRLASHTIIAAERGTDPLLILDDVLSELDERRAEALLAHLPGSQTLLTSAQGVPAGVQPQTVVSLDG